MRALNLSLLGALAVTGCRGGESDKPPVHLIHNMDTQERAKAYRRDDTGLFKDGRQMHLPVEGTVAQGQLDADPVMFQGIDAKGEPTKEFPAAVKVDGKIPDSLAERGQGRFQIYCAPCHGPLGDGKGTVAGVALDGGPRLTVPPPSFTDERRKGLVAGQFFAAISGGVNAGNMPAYALQLPAEDRWAVIAYIRKDIQHQDYEGGEAVVAVKVDKASAEAGLALFKAKGCNACHSIDGSKLVGPSFKGVYGKTESTSAGDVAVDDAYIKESMLQPLAKVVTGFPPAMPPQTLNDLEIQSLTLFIASLK